MSNQNNSDKNEKTNEAKHSPQFNFYDLDWEQNGYYVEAYYLDYRIEIEVDSAPGFHNVEVYRTNEQDLKYSKYGRRIFDDMFIDSRGDDLSIAMDLELAIVRDLVGHDIVGTGNDWRSFTRYGC